MLLPSIIVQIPIMASMALVGWFYSSSQPAASLVTR
jgi:hypothetical protein